MTIKDWLPFLRDPSDSTQTSLEFFEFDSNADFGPPVGRSCGVLLSVKTGKLFPYCTPIVFFERTTDVEFIFTRVQAELDRRPEITSRGELIGSQESCAIVQRAGLFSKDQVVDYDKHLVDSPFWTALQQITLSDWERHLPDPGSGPLLDLGCGTGRCMVALMTKGYRMIGLDLSYPMLRPIAGRSDVSFDNGLLLLASATRLPLNDSSISAVTCFGTLHHVPSPERALREISRVLRPNAVFQALEPNQSPFRIIFDRFMTLLPLWEEEAGEDNLFSEKKVTRWTEGLPLRWHFRYSVFLLPHLFWFIKSTSVIKLAISVSDWLGRLPLVQTWGGLLLFRGTKA